MEAVPGVSPQLYADNLKCLSSSPGALLSAARFTNLYISLVGQEAAPRKCVLLSTSREVRTDMASWLVTDAGDTWTVKLDVRDLGGHLDLTFRGRATALCKRIDGVFCLSPVVHALPLDLGSRLRVLRTMLILAALYGAEASCVSDLRLCRHGSAFVRGAWSGRLTLANPGAILTPLDGPVGSDPAFNVVWCRFRMMRRFLAFCSGVLDTARIHRLLGEVVAGAAGHGPVHLLLSSAGTIGFAWDPVQCVWVTPGLPHLCQLASPYQFFKSAVWDAWCAKIACDLGARQGFRSGGLLDLRWSLRMLRSSHVRDRDKGLLRGTLPGVCVERISSRTRSSRSRSLSLLWGS